VAARERDAHFKLKSSTHRRQILDIDRKDTALGFEIAVVKDATGATRHPELGDGYQNALGNFGFNANAVLSTDDAIMAVG